MTTTTLEQQLEIVEKLNDAIAGIQESPSAISLYQEICTKLSQNTSGITPCSSNPVQALSEIQTQYTRHFYPNTYCPRIDVAVSHVAIMNGKLVALGLLKSNQNEDSNSGSDWKKFLDAFCSESNVWKVLKSAFGEHRICGANRNPAFLVGIEIENSSSTKYLAGDFINATILSKIGVVIASQKVYKKAMQLIEYIKLIEDLGKSDGGFASYFINKERIIAREEIAAIISEIRQQRGGQQ